MSVIAVENIRFGEYVVADFVNGTCKRVFSNAPRSAVAGENLPLGSQVTFDFQLGRARLARSGDRPNEVAVRFLPIEDIRAGDRVVGWRNAVTDVDQPDSRLPSSNVIVLSNARNLCAPRGSLIPMDYIAPRKKTVYTIAFITEDPSVANGYRNLATHTVREEEVDV